MFESINIFRLLDYILIGILARGRRKLWTYGNCKALLYRDENDTQECTEHNKKVEFVNLPNLVSSRNINQANDCCHNDCTQYNIWCVLEQRHEEEESHHDSNRHYHIRHSGFCSSIVIDSRAGESTWNSKHLQMNIYLCHLLLLLLLLRKAYEVDMAPVVI